MQETKVANDNSFGFLIDRKIKNSVMKHQEWQINKLIEIYTSICVLDVRYCLFSLKRYDFLIHFIYLFFIK